MTGVAPISSRQTKYCEAIREILSRFSHATNNELLTELKKTYPQLSATTVHRATARLAGRDEISPAPAGLDGAMRYDANTKPHDHFMCTVCDCRISGRLTISGVCKRCLATTTA
jgi:Fur family transcriptional regulator, peroxide stress response regulator